MKCVLCSKSISDGFYLKDNAHLGSICSKKCGEIVYLGGKYNNNNTDSSDDDDEVIEESEESLLQKLEATLKLSVSQSRVLSIRDPKLKTKIIQDLGFLGVCYISIDKHENTDIKRNTANLMTETFPLIPNKDKDSMLQFGDFSGFCDFWHEKKFSVSQIWGKSSGMPYPPILELGSRNNFKMGGNIFVKNPLTSLNSIKTWETLILNYPQINPLEWVPKDNEDRINVSEDGIKITCGKTYNPTGLHYDGQFGTKEDIESDRIQIVYSDDSGPMRLFVVPRSATLPVRELIQKLTGIEIKSGFDKGKLQEHPRVFNLLHKYGVAIKGPGIQMFKTAVWHFEAAEASEPIQQLLTGPKLNEKGIYSYEISKSKTKLGSSFRIYCGIVTIKPTENNIENLIRFAYLREHEWNMDPFSVQNKNNRQGVFVNDKNNQAHSVFSSYEENEYEWKELQKKPLVEMKKILNNLTDLRLSLYGLERNDLN
jgi:hypothetical protein